MSFWTDLREGVSDFAKETYDVALDVGGWAMGAMTGYNPRAEYVAQKAQKQSLKLQQQAYNTQANEIERQKRIQQAQQRRENMQLMNAISNLTNTSYSGVSSPSVDYDKYGDMG